MSVIIPCFNDGRTLPEAVDSALRQEACEIVVIDDGSDDVNTAGVLDALRETGVRVLRQDNQGAAAARVAGLAATTAPYVFPLDADDLIAPGALAELADTLDANPSTAAAWGDIEVFGDHSASQRGPRRLDAWLLTYVNNLTGAATLIRRERLLEVGGWQMRDGYETWDVWLGFAERGWTGIYLPRPVLRYRKHGVRLSSITQPAFAELYQQLRDRHPGLFLQRRMLWRQSQAPWRLKFALPIIGILPLSPLSRHRLQNFVDHPTRFFLVRRARISRRIALVRRQEASSAPAGHRGVSMVRTDAAADRLAPPTAARSQISTSVLTYATNLGVALLSLVSVLIVSRVLGPSGRGSVAFLTAVAVLTHYASTLGVQEANVNIAGMEQSARRALATNSIVLAGLFGGVAAVAVAAISSVFPAVTGHARPGLVWLALASVPVQLVGTYLSRLVQADYRFGLSNAAWIAAPALIVGVNSSLFALDRLSVSSALAAWVAGQTLTAFILIGAVAHSPGFGLPRADLAVQTVRFGIKVHPATVMSFTNYRLDQWLLGVLATRRELGLYSVAVSWSEALFFLPTAISYAQRPHLVRGSASDAARNTALGFRAATIATLPLVVGLILAAPLLCTTIFGAPFRGSIVDLRILTLGSFGILAVKLLGNALTAQGRPLLQTAGTSVAFVFTVALDLLLIPHNGGTGAAIASAVAYTAGGVAMASIFVRTMHRHVGELIPRVGDLHSTARRLRRLLGSEVPQT